MMEIKTILMLTEKYAEKTLLRRLREQLHLTELPYRTYMYNGCIFNPFVSGLHALHSRPYLDWQLQSNIKESGEFYSFQQKV